METITTKIPVLPVQIKKKAEQIFKKYEHSALKRLQKAESKNPRHPFFVRNFFGKKISALFFKWYLRNAETALTQENWDEAEKKLHLAMRWDSQKAEVWFLTALLNVQKYTEKSAIAAVSCALQLEPDFMKARILRVRLEMQNARLIPAAIVDWYHILEVSPEVAEAWEQLGILFFRLNDLSNSAICLRRAAELEPEDLTYWLKLVENLVLQRDFEQVEERCSWLVKQYMEVLSKESHEPVETPEQRKALLEKKTIEKQDFRLKDFYWEILFNWMIALNVLKRPDEESEVCKEALLYKDEELSEKSNVEKSGEKEWEGGENRSEKWNRRERHSMIMNRARIGLAENYSQKEQWAEALTLYQEQIRKNGETKEIVQNALACLNQLEKPEELEEFCSELIAKGTKFGDVYHARGITRMLHGKPNEGTEDILQAVKLEPNEPEFWLSYARVLMLGHQVSEALKALKRVLELSPGMLSAGLFYIHILEQLDRTDEVLSVMEKLIENVPSRIDALVLKGDLCFRKKDFQGAKKAYNEAVAMDPKHPIALIGRSRVWEEEENWQKAYEDASAVIQIAPEIIWSYFHRAMYAANLKNFPQALSDLHHFIEQKPAELRGLLLLGEIRFEMKQPEAALVLFQKVLAKDPHCVVALQRSAEAKSSLNLHEPALADIELAIQTEPGNRDLKEIKIQLLLKLNRENDALEYCTSTLEQDPENGSVRYNRGVLFLNTHRPEDALPDFEWVCEHEPEAVQPHFARALALNALFRHDEAMEALDRALKIQPDFIPALSEKAMTHSILGDPKQSLALLEKILEKKPNDVSLLNIYGTVLANEQRIEDAMRAFQKATDIQPDFTPALNNLGHMQMLLGNWDEGIQSLSLAISSNSKWGRPYLNRALIYMRMHELNEAENDISEARRIAQKAGDEDVLVDAIELQKKLNVLKKLIGTTEEEGFMPELNLDEEDSWETPDSDEQNPWDEKDFEGADFWKNILSEYDDEEDFDDVDSEKEKTETGNDSENEDDSENEQFSIGSFWDLNDWEEDENEPETGENEIGDDEEDEFEIWDEDEDEDEEDDEDEDPEDFDFLVDGEDDLTNLTSDFMQVEEFFSDEIPSKSQDVGKNLWPKFECCAKTPIDAGDSGGQDAQGGRPVEMMLNYADFSNDVTEPERKKVTPAKIQQATNFFTMLFQFWTPENLKPIEGREDFDGESYMIPPFIINCPQFFHQLPKNDSEMPQNEAGAGNEFDFEIPTSNYFRYQKDRELFFEQLTALSELLDRELAKAKTLQEEKLAKKHKREFHFLTEMIMKSLINKENELLLVITNFLTEETMNSLGGE